MPMPQALSRLARICLAGAWLAGAAVPALAARIAAVSPQGEVATVRQVSVRFDADVVPLGDPRLPPPVALQCEKLAVKGTGRWNSARQWVFDFNEPLPAASRCTLRAVPGWKPLGGTALEGAAEFSFGTAGPAIEQIWPPSYQSIEEDQHFLLKLTGPVVPATVAANAWCEVEGLGERIGVKPVEGAPREALLARYKLREQAARVLLLACARPFAASAKVRLVWGSGIAASLNPKVLTATPQRYEWSVRERFEAEFSCERERAEAPCMPLRAMSLRFSAPVPRKALAEARLTPASGAALKPVFDDSSGPETVQVLRFPTPLPESTAFTLSLPRELRDESGRVLANAGSFPLRTSTGAMPPLAKLAAAPFGIVEAGPEAMLPVTVRSVQADLAGLSASGQVRVKRLDASTSDSELLQWIGKVQRYHESSMTAKEAGLPASQWKETVEEEGDDGKPRRFQRDREIATRELTLLSGRPEVKSVALPALADATDAKAANPAPRPFEVLGIPLPQTGYHVVEIESRLLGAQLLAKPAPMYVRGGVLVTQLGVHFKRGRESSLVWVTTLDRAQPVAGARVAVNECHGKQLWSGVTDAQGRALIPRGFDNSGMEDCVAHSAYFVTARSTDKKTGNDDLAFVFSDWSQGIEPWRFNLPTADGTEPDWRAHTVFDRTLLRAGETVAMKHYLRTETQRGLALPPAAEMPDAVRLTHEGSGEKVELPLSWRAGAQAGTSVSSWAIPATAKLGSYDVVLLRKGSATGAGQREWASGSFRVEAFRLPLLDARLSGPKGAQVAPAELAFQLQLNYQAGGGVANAPTQLSALLRERSPSFAGYDDYSFRPPEAFANGQSDEQESESRGDGSRIVADKLALRTDAQGAAKGVVKGLPALDRPSELVAEMGFSDPNGEVQTVTQTVPLWPSALVAGLRARSWVASRGTVNVQAVVLDHAGKPLANRAVTVQAQLQRTLSTRKRMVGGFYAYEHTREVKELGQLCSGKTDARGLLLCEAKVDSVGEVQLIAEAKDDAGRSSRSATSVWVTGQGELWFPQDNDDRIDLLPEKRELQPGETARLQVRMPYREATALVAVEREGVMETQVVTLRGDDPVIELKVPAADSAQSWAPNVFVSVLVMRGRVRDVPWYSFFSWGWKAPLDWWRAWRTEGPDYKAPTAMVDLAKPSFKLGVAQLRVGLDAQRLQVSVAADKPQYSVRQTAKVRVKVMQGNTPAAGAQVAFAAVDEALLALKDNESWDLLDSLLQPRGWGVETSTAQSEIIGRRHYGRKAVPAGGGGGRNPTRELFDTLLLWRADVALDAQGEALIDVPLNDSLTRFRLVAVASRLGGDKGFERFGTGSATITVSQDLQLLAGLPPLVREGDQFQATLTLRNTTARAMKVKATLSAEAAGPASAASAASAPSFPAKEVDVAAGAAVELQWPVSVPVGPTGLAWTASAEEQGRSGAERASDRIKVAQQVAPAVPLRIWAAQLLKLDGPQSLPVAAPADALTLPGGAARGGLQLSLRPKLAGAQPGVQRFFEQYPFQCLEQQASRAVGLHDAAAWGRMAAGLPGYLDSDGLAMYYPASDGPPRGSDRLSAYLLSLSAEAGLALPDGPREQLLQGLTAFVEGRIERRFNAPRADLDVRKLAALEALSRHGRASVRQLGSLQITPQRWPTAALIDWWLVLRRLEDLPERARRLEEAQQLLRSRLTYAGTQLRFSTEADDFWWWLMDSADANAAKLILAAADQPAWKDDVPAMVLGALARQRNGAWLTTTANAWGTLALDRFSARFEAVPVAGQSVLALGAAQAKVDWAATPQGAQRELPWSAAAASLQASHQGAGQPWLSVQTLAAVPLKAPL
ncbi:MAG TPA: MG2 domain-containing protein [Ideonella sp.]|nr:MG2 domain-containing protein [Ideonella sp.]